MVYKKPTLDCSVIQTASDPSDDSSVWFILSAVFLAIICLCSAILFLRKVSRPATFENLSLNRYRIKIVSLFHDFGSHILSLIVIIHSVIKGYSIPWQPIQIDSYSDTDTTDTTDSMDLMIYINPNTVSCSGNKFAWTDSAVIGGQVCYMVPVEADTPYGLEVSDSFIFPLYDAVPISMLVFALLTGLVTAVLKVKYSLYPENKHHSFVIQCIIYSIPISASYFTLTDIDYCYGWNSAYQGYEGSLSYLLDSANVLIWISNAFMFCFFLWHLLKVIFKLRDCCSGTSTNRIIVFASIFSVTIGFAYRIITYLQGFEQYLNPTLLTNDLIFYFHTILSLSPVLEMTPLARFFRIARNGFRTDSDL